MKTTQSRLFHILNKTVFYGFFYAFFLIIEIFNWMGFLCDELFYRPYKKLNVEAPVFIIGMPRTATSLLFNILSEDKDRFSAMKLWEIIFAPSITQKKFFIALNKLDRFLNGFFLNSLRKLDEKIFHRFEKIHHISLFNVEEDEYILLHNLSCSLLVFIFPKWKYISALIKFDNDLTVPRKERIMAYYRKCVQKHMYVFAPYKTYLAKSPSHTSKIDSLKNTFPGCKFIYTLRIPEECISSAIGMYKVYNKIFRTNAKIETLAEVTLSFADLWYASTSIIENMDNETAIILKYDDIAKSSEISIRHIYKAFCFQLSEYFESKLIWYDKKSKSYKSKHDHSLEYCGLTVSDIRKRYKKTYENYFNEN